MELKPNNVNFYKHYAPTELKHQTNKTQNDKMLIEIIKILYRHRLYRA